MTELPPIAPLLVRQVRYHLRLLVRNPRAMTTGVLLPGLLLFLRGSPGHADEVAGAVAGLTALGVGMLGYASFAASLVTARESGVLRRWRASPLPSWCYFTGRITATVVLALAGTAITVAVGVVEFGSPVHDPVGLALVIGLGALAFAALGTAVTRVIATADSAQPVLMFTYLPVLFLSGALGPVNGLPAWVAGLMHRLPPGALVNGMSATLRGGTLPLGDLAVLGAWGIGGLVLACVVFRWDPVPPSARTAKTARVPA
ncbi:ABC transporter permease [Labedaea rhizosphaerae]|uniref:ABC-2 type transport system permease protein n=1 Tax=Labedaea rhizosphaerae TaxID=598644 RepID=A0A4V3CXL1_LABRH|nr:ABC transporter permease [Labedaea rhizosphaerae]TDP90478.1 ABC-2 type transport system permease protein [Labedaea rhizosphaerae]